MRVSQSILGAALASLFLLAFGHTCFADSIVYSNLGTGNDVYDTNNAWAVDGATIYGGQAAPAFSFTSSSTVQLTQLDIALTHLNGTNAVTVDLMSDSGGPGSVLESWSVSGLPFVTTCCTLQSLAGNGTIPLESGVSYWVAVLPGADDTQASWEFNSTGASTDMEYENYGTGWVPNKVVETYVTGAFEVLGTGSTSPSTVPEPGTMTLLGSGILGLAGLLRRRLRRSK